MKTINLIVFLAILSLAAVSAGTESPEGYGEEVPLEAPEGGAWGFFDWSPDGKWFVLSYMPGLNSGLYLFPVSGGSPINLTELGYTMTENVLFTSDSQNVIFVRLQFGEIIRDYGDGHVVGKNIYPTVEKINIYTGATETVAYGYLFTASPDGRFFIYRNFDNRVFFDDLQTEHQGEVVVMDTITGEKKYIPEEEISFSSYYGIIPWTFSPDSKYLVFSKFMGANEADKRSQLFRTTIKDGTIDFEHAEQITFENENPWSKYREEARFSPDGNWIVHGATQFFDELVEWIDINGNKTERLVAQPYKNLVAFNLNTGKEIILLPDTINKTYNPWSHPSFTTKGDQIAYILRKEEDVNKSDSFSLRVLDMPEALKPGPSFVETGVPSGFALLGNYPNPFNPSTTIEYSLSEAGFADLVIYNVMGQKVRELVMGQMTQGVHSVVWDGRDDHGLPVSAGVYMPRLRMNGSVAAGRMMLVK